MKPNRRLKMVGIPVAGAVLVVAVIAWVTGGRRTADGYTSADADPIGVPRLTADFSVPISTQDNGSGGIIAYDLTGDGKIDFLISQPGVVTAVSATGETLWRREADIQVTGQSERFGLPGWHAPGVQAADIDGDRKVEVLYLSRNGLLTVVDGETGTLIHERLVDAPEEAARWEHLAVADFRGTGERDVLLQATNNDGYRLGRFIAAYALDDLLYAKRPRPLWERSDFTAMAHSGARVADLDGDGRHEVISGDIVGPDGDLIYRLPLRGHVDGVQVADVRRELTGLEVVAVEEGAGPHELIKADVRGAWRLNQWLGPLFSNNRVFLFGVDGLIWQTNHENTEPQNSAVGDFRAAQSGLEIWCRSRHETNQQPFVFSAHGEPVSSYSIAQSAPAGWTAKGLEEIWAIHWTGGFDQLIAAKARHESGDVAILDPMTGEFLAQIPEQADRLYVADVIGDWREEIVVLAGDRLRIYSNPSPNPRPDHDSLWNQDHYKRAKMTWNYYNT